LLSGGTLGQVLDPDRQLQLFADQAEARRLVDDEPAVTLVRPTGKENMQGGANRFRQRFRVAGGHVVHLPVGDHDDTGEALARHVRHCPIERGKEAGPLVAGAGLRLPRADHPDIEVAFA
jgi:hypothetical protein